MAELEIKGIGSIEEIKAAYFNQGALRQPNYRLCQINVRGSRYYYNMNENGCEFYPSVTTLIHNVAPENKILTEWKLALGKEAAEAFTMERANYGSMIHGFLQELVVTRKFNLDEIREKMLAYVKNHRLPDSFVDIHETEAREDMLSFAKWMKDYDVVPYAVEISLYHPELKYAGMTDLVCNLRKYPVGDKHGDERVDAIVDFKTSRKGFHSEHIWQLEMYRLAWNLHFPDLPITEIANIRPKDWASTVKKQVSYEFIWQTEDPEVQKVPLLLELFKLEEQKSRNIAIVSGTIDLNESLDSNIQVKTLEQIVLERSKDLEEAEETDESLF